MEQEMKISTLRQIIIMQALDALENYERTGVLAEVTKMKRERDILSGEKKAELFGITKPEQFLVFNAELIECAIWDIKKENDDIVAIASSCKMCEQAKARELPSPCHLYCINPVDGVVQGVEGGYKLSVEETLWNGTECRFRISHQ